MRTDATYIGVVLAVLWGLVGPVAAQVVPDNRDPRLDPEDSVPPAYRETLDSRDEQRLDAAREAGESFIPLLQGGGAAPGEDAPAAAAQPVTAPSPPQQTYEGYRTPERTTAPASGREDRPVGDLIGVLIESWTRPPDIVRLRYATTDRDAVAVEDRDPIPEEAREPRPAAAIVPRIEAGRGLYARTLYAVDSNFPGPVLLELLEPPLMGAVAAGQFTLVGERLTLRLTRLEYRGRSVPVDAWAVGLDCACYGVDGEVDSHWVERVLLPSAVRFAEGFLDALSRPVETVILGDEVRYERREAATRDAVHAGLATAARAAGDVLLENAPDGPSVHIPRDTELVVVFATAPGETGEPGAARHSGDG